MSKSKRPIFTRQQMTPCVLTVAGSDSSGGAGIQGDSRTIQALGGYAATIITALTAQNTRGVMKVAAVSPNMIELQLRAVLADLPIRAIKSGLLPNAAAILCLEEAVKRHPGIPLVVDPVLASSSGTRFLSRTGAVLLKEKIFPLATLITPNWLEAQELTGLAVNRLADAREAASLLLTQTGCQAVLLKGGHGPGDLLIDLLAVKNRPVVGFSHPRIETLNTHGTGCVLSAAIATLLAQGWELEKAVVDAIDFLQTALAKGRSKLWGGRGPALS